eukprot:1785886-Rhodomonas_salina.1
MVVLCVQHALPLQTRERIMSSDASSSEGSSDASSSEGSHHNCVWDDTCIHTERERASGYLEALDLARAGVLHLDDLPGQIKRICARAQYPLYQAGRTTSLIPPRCPAGRVTCLSMSREGASAEICAESFSICVLVCPWGKRKKRRGKKKRKKGKQRGKKEETRQTKK